MTPLHNIVETIEIRRLRWAGHGMRSQNSLLRMVLEQQNPVVKRLLGRPKLRWEDIVKSDVEDLGRNVLAMNGDGWRIGCDTAWRLINPKEEDNDPLEFGQLRTVKNRFPVTIPGFSPAGSRGKCQSPSAETRCRDDETE